MRRALLPLAAMMMIAAKDPPPPAPAPAPPADPQTIPPAVRAMLDAAMATGNDGEVNTVEKYARLGSPESADAIAELIAMWRSAKQNSATRAIQQAQFLELVTGRVELGGYYTTGNTNNVGLTGRIQAQREGLRWRHKLNLLGEYQESLGTTTREHYLAAYEPNYKIDERAYIYGAMQFESDQYLGYFERYSASIGAGYSVIKSAPMTLDLELGPAYRRTRFTDQLIESNLAARGKVDFDWRLTSGLTFSQDASAYVQSANSTLTGMTALNAKLWGPLSAQMSYNISYESKPPLGRVKTDTTSRASLVYTF